MRQVSIKNQSLSLDILNYGAIVQKLLVKDKYGQSVNVVVGFEDPSEYLHDRFFLGACIGRYAGRISGGGFYLDGKHHMVHSEDGVHLHGGKEGFGKKYWTFEKVVEGDNPFAELSYSSKHMEEGYPGNLKVRVRYRLVNSSLEIVQTAKTDRPTVVNLTNHSYFHLDNSSSIDHHELQINAKAMIKTLPNLLPTGEIVDTANTSYDFSEKKAINGVRLDTPFAINAKTKEVASLSSEVSGIRMRVFSNQPAVVVFTPLEFPGICFETQNFPDAPNKKSFPSARLNPGETYTNKTVFDFDLVT